jgi:hypothetical protein
MSHHVEGPEQVDVDHLLEDVGWVRGAVLAERAHRKANTRAAHRSTQRGLGHGEVHGGLYVALRGDVGLDEAC